jgi:hypothetical protein
MSPVEPPSELRAQLQDEIERNRRWEHRLPLYGGIALIICAAIVVVRVVFLHA